MNPLFVESFNIQEHPIKNAKKNIREEYIIALTYIVENTINELDESKADIEKYISKRLHLYRSQLSVDGKTTKDYSKCLLSFKSHGEANIVFYLSVI